MRLGSVATGIRKIDVTGLPAIGAIVEAIHAEPASFQALANRAISFASALVFRLVTLNAENLADSHRGLLKITLT